MRALAARLGAAGIETVVRDSEAQVLWSKLVRLNALACATGASGRLLGAIRDDPAWQKVGHPGTHNAHPLSAAAGACWG